MAVRRPTPGFADLGVPAPLVSALAGIGVHEPFPIQAATLPDSLAGRDVLGRGRTGSGKTYAFLIPVLARLAGGRPARPGKPRALVLAPTRELATQILESAEPLARALGLRATTVFGGVRPGPQITALKAGVDLLVACPGRLADHLAEGHAALDDVAVTVLDEADHMADLGFLPAVRRLLDRTPRDGQRLLFSATLDNGIDVLVDRYLTDPVTHSVDSAKSPVAAMTHHVLHVDGTNRLPVLVDLASAPGRSLVFTRTRRGATRLTRQLVAAGVRAVELHGDLGQNARTRNLTAFAEGTAPTLVATDIAARGIHVDDVTLVIHADPPVEHKAYLHRSGRTARAGASGTVVTLMTDEQVEDVRALTKKAGITPTTTKAGPGHPLLAQLAPGERVLVAPDDRPAPPKRPQRKRKPAAKEAGEAAQPKQGRQGKENPRAPKQAEQPKPPRNRDQQPKERTPRGQRTRGQAQQPRAAEQPRSGAQQPSGGGAAAFSARSGRSRRPR
ncbi:DEAD/DEAH box helicase [Actinokineospora bangkokensis]|uniref:RNA helicase n=1 Tax=Actinokineospora bangkokensis TaxID=1193682 RepID=A0A1Q9LIA7_9PSEU|nr:DEAD/DEAH box helicase [Actinokineospora bangkokensis]OLR91724.1 RNA helicase [Actinokineospora bangkokensis]